MPAIPDVGQRRIPLDEWKRFVRVADWWDRTYGHKPPAALPPKGGFVGFQFSYNISPRPLLDASWYTLPLIAQDTTPALWVVPNSPGWTADATTDEFTCFTSGWYRVALLLHTNVYTARGTKIQFLHTPLGETAVVNGGAYRFHPPYDISDTLNAGYLTWGRLADSIYSDRWLHCCEGDTVKFQAANYGNFRPNGNGNQTEAWFYQIEFERLAPLL